MKHPPVIAKLVSDGRSGPNSGLKGKNVDVFQPRLGKVSPLQLLATRYLEAGKMLRKRSANTA